MVFLSVLQPIGLSFFTYLVLYQIEIYMWNHNHWDQSCDIIQMCGHEVTWLPIAAEGKSATFPCCLKTYTRTGKWHDWTVTKRIRWQWHSVAWLNERLMWKIRHHQAIHPSSHQLDIYTSIKASLHPSDHPLTLWMSPVSTWPSSKLKLSKGP